MKQYTIGVTVSCKKLMKVMAHNKNDAITKAEIVVYDTNAMHFDSNDIVNVSVDPEPPRPIQRDKTDEIDGNLDTVSCSNCLRDEPEGKCTIIVIDIPGTCGLVQERVKANSTVLVIGRVSGSNGERGFSRLAAPNRHSST